jgi:hypothetical protein
MDANWGGGRVRSSGSHQLAVDDQEDSPSCVEIVLVAFRMVRLCPNNKGNFGVGKMRYTAVSLTNPGFDITPHPLGLDELDLERPMRKISCPQPPEKQIFVIGLRILVESTTL